jgi:hypothetical protein
MKKILFCIFLANATSYGMEEATQQIRSILSEAKLSQRVAKNWANCVIVPLEDNVLLDIFQLSCPILPKIVERYKVYVSDKIGIPSTGVIYSEGVDNDTAQWSA